MNSHGSAMQKYLDALHTNAVCAIANVDRCSQRLAERISNDADTRTVAYRILHRQYHVAVADCANTLQRIDWTIREYPHTKKFLESARRGCALGSHYDVCRCDV